MEIVFCIAARLLRRLLCSAPRRAAADFANLCHPLYFATCVQSRRLLTSSPASLHRTPSRTYYPSNAAQSSQVVNILPLLATLPCLAIYYYGRADHEQKTKALRRTVTGGADFEERLKRKKVRTGPQRKEESE